MSKSDQEGLQLDCGVVLTKDDLDRLETELFRRFLAHPQKQEWLKAADHQRSLLAIFPDYPVNNRSRVERFIRAKWYKDQGFSPRASNAMASYDMSPLWLLTARELDLTTKRQVGTGIWEEVKQWQEKNRDKIPKEG